MLKKTHFLQWGFPNDKSNIEPLKWGIKQKFIAHKIFPKLRLSNPLKTTELENMKNFIKRWHYSPCPLFIYSLFWFVTVNYAKKIRIQQNSVKHNQSHPIFKQARKILEDVVACFETVCAKCTFGKYTFRKDTFGKCTFRY